MYNQNCGSSGILWILIILVIVCCCCGQQSFSPFGGTNGCGCTCGNTGTQPFSAC